MICSAFLSSANKAEFLDLGYVSSTVGQPVRPDVVPDPRAVCRAPPSPEPCLAAAFQQLMERLQRIVKLPHRLRPAQTSKVEPVAVPLPAVPTGSPGHRLCPAPAPPAPVSPRRSTPSTGQSSPAAWSPC